jgi:hypothetical protein
VFTFSTNFNILHKIKKKKKMSIEKIIQKSEVVDLSDTDILNITNGRCAIHTYADLERFRTIDQVLGDWNCAVILYQHEEDFGHWVTLFKVDKNTLEFFDPYGIEIDRELKQSPFNTRRHQGKIVPHLSHLIKQSRYRLIQNRKKLQSFKQDVNTCGRWVSLRVRWRYIALEKFVQMFSGTHFDGDFYASALTKGIKSFSDLFCRVEPLWGTNPCDPKNCLYFV